jgi:hypothetical protein
MVRAYNRISVFIAFMCIAIVCMLFERILRSKSLASRTFSAKKITVYAVIVLLFCFSAVEQLPGPYTSADYNSAAKEYLSDDAFVAEIEAEVPEDSMILQLPYHEYPEGGAVNNMNDYSLLVGYLHSDSLRWSFGASKGGMADAWIKDLSCQPVSVLVNSAVKAGYAGIYVDTRAYTDEDLSELKEELYVSTGTEPLISMDDNLLFYNLDWLKENTSIAEN